MRITPEVIIGIFGLILTVLSIVNTFLILRDRAQAPQKELERSPQTDGRKVYIA